MDCNSPDHHSNYGTDSYRGERRHSSRLPDEEMVLLSEIGPMLTLNVERIPRTRRIQSLTRRGCAGVVLESLRIGKRRFTTIEALERFTERVVIAAPDDWPGILLRTLRVD